MFSRAANLLPVFALAACTINPGKPLPPPADAVPILRISIPARFDTVPLTVETLRDEVLKCLPTESREARLSFDVTANFPETNAVRAFEHWRTANRFIADGASGFCLHYSVAGYPVLAAEAFLHTINPVGVAGEVQEEWNRRLATMIAIQGAARVAYVYANGSGLVARYWVEGKGTPMLHYASEGYRSKEALLQEQLDAVFSDSGLRGVSTVRRSLPLSRQAGANTKRRLLAHRSEPEPPVPPSLKP